MGSAEAVTMEIWTDMWWWHMMMPVVHNEPIPAHEGGSSVVKDEAMPVPVVSWITQPEGARGQCAINTPLLSSWWWWQVHDAGQAVAVPRGSMCAGRPWV